jgi:hypothetical protein
VSAVVRYGLKELALVYECLGVADVVCKRLLTAGFLVARPRHAGHRRWLERHCQVFGARWRWCMRVIRRAESIFAVLTTRLRSRWRGSGSVVAVSATAED